MFKKSFIGMLLTAVLVTMWSVGGLAPKAEAARVVNKCAIVKSTTVGGINFGPLKVNRSCVTHAIHGVGGKARLSRNTAVVMYHNGTSSPTQIAKTTTHELTHFVEYKTTNFWRKRLYAHLGVRTNGNFSDVKTISGRNLAKWKKSERERLAESVVQCRFGTPTFTGMKLVPTNKCSAFIRDLNNAIRASK